MNCNKCGKVIDDNQKFCMYCGHLVEKRESPNETSPSEPVVFSNPYTMPTKEEQPEAGIAGPPESHFAIQPSLPESTVLQSSLPQPQIYVANPAPKKKKLGFLFGAIGLAAVAALVIFFIVRPGAGGDFLNTAIAGVREVMNEESFDFNLTSSVIDSYSNENINIHGSINLDYDEKNVNFDITFEEGKEISRIIMYKNTLLQIEDGEVYYGQDLNVEIKEMFSDLDQYLNNAIDINVSDIKNKLMDEGMANNPFAERLLNEETLNDLLQKIKDNFNDKEFLEEYFGYKKEGNVYSLELTPRKLIEAMVILFKDTFPELSMISSELDGLLGLNEMKCNLSIGFDGKYISNFQIGVQAEDTSVNAEGNITNYGKSSLDNEELEGYYNAWRLDENWD